MNKYLASLIVVGSLVSNMSYSNSMDNKVIAIALGVPTLVWTAASAFCLYTLRDAIEYKRRWRHSIEDEVIGGTVAGVSTIVGACCLYGIYRFYQESEKHDRWMEEHNRKYGR